MTVLAVTSWHFNPRSLAGATPQHIKGVQRNVISIHAPLRERPRYSFSSWLRAAFQSTLPCGSDSSTIRQSTTNDNFNPRSLAGATQVFLFFVVTCSISIHAPLRERHITNKLLLVVFVISIHAPLRERPTISHFAFVYGYDFNPRSLAGATKANDWAIRCVHISIHAPLRERPTD